MPIGIQITFIIFCWITICACIFSIIYSVVDLIRDRHETKRREEEELKQKREKEYREEQYKRDREYYKWLIENYPLTAIRYVSQEQLDKMQVNLNMEMVKKERPE